MIRLSVLLAASLNLMGQAVAWKPWAPASFAEAKGAGRMVLVDAEATWCHWCHVMDERTYADPEVAALLNAHFAAIKADIDLHPDAQELYSDIGWPGTTIYAPEGAILYRHRGFIPPGAFKAILRDALAGKLRPEAAEAPASVDGPAGSLAVSRDKARKELDARFDPAYGGWGEQKYPIAMNLEEALCRGEDGAKWRALYTLKQQRAITDPVWGGLYQYSAGPDWHQVHFERLTVLQAQYLENLAEAFRATGDRDFLEDAKPVLAYLHRFMAHPDGGFSATLDADLGGYDKRAGFMDGHDYYRLGDAERMKHGLPRIDARRYGKEQGLLISALARLSGVMDEAALLNEARAALAYADSKLAAPDGAYFHEAGQRDAIFLADQAALLKGLLALHEATGEAAFLDRALKLEATVRARLRDASGLLRSRSLPPGAAGALAETRLPFDDNVAWARCELRLEAFTGQTDFKARAEAILKALGTETRLEDQGRWLGDFVLAVSEWERGLGHAAVVGSRRDPRTLALFHAAQRVLLPGTVVILHDPADGEPRNPDLGFPSLKDPAVFLCGGGSCSKPFTDPERLADDLRKASRR